MAKKERYHEIDVLRGMTIFAMIVIHATAYFLQDKSAFFLWDSFQFAVPVFLFCSAYILFKRNQTIGVSRFASYFIKRAKRLLIPYWIFLLFYVPLVYFYEPINMASVQILRFITLTTSGNDLSWLVLLFIFSSILTPFILFLHKKHRASFWGFGALSLIGSIVLLAYPSPVHFKFVMWLPWTLMFYFTWYFVREEHSPKLLWLFAASLLTYAVSLFYLARTGQTLTHYANKYPPNLFHLSYGMSFIIALYYLAKKKVFDLPGLKKFISFLSVNSYSIYFIHFLILYVMTTYAKGIFLNLSWWKFFVVLFCQLSACSATDG